MNARVEPAAGTEVQRGGRRWVGFRTIVIREFSRGASARWAA